ncbi:hypothetical protein H359_1035 [Chlamydia ibidis 10-1398/6]|uniref:Uncharacterized protein n=1 Tax=Chlamydia ibidis 10-1398/6 TaxID=1046581 RepID=A0ABN0MYA3_9CHLA|nr:hypothetical protein H359_1035 [Chlamydia ibidis 10-1398/6]
MGAIEKSLGVTELTALSVEFPDSKMAINNWKGVFHPVSEGSGLGNSVSSVVIM